MSSVFPAAIIYINNDLTANTLKYIVKQLHINIIFDTNNDGYDGYDNFDGYVAANPDYVAGVRKNNIRVLVMRPFTDFTNRDVADVVVFVKQAMASVLITKRGPPAQTYPLIDLYWRQLGVFD